MSEQFGSGQATRDSSMVREGSYFEMVEGWKRRVVDVVKKTERVSYGDVKDTCATKIRNAQGQT
jgi:hypothetical protein